MQFIGSLLGLVLPYKILCAGVWPGNGIVKGFTGFNVPNQGSFTLVCDANGLDLLGGVAQIDESFGGEFYTFFDGLNYFLWILLMPSTVISTRRRERRKREYCRMEHTPNVRVYGLVQSGEKLRVCPQGRR